MILVDAVLEIRNRSDKSVILAQRPFAWGAASKIAELDGEGRVPIEAVESGYEYLLERAEVLRLLEYASRKKMSDRAKAELIVHYARCDAFPAWYDDIPDV